MPAFEGAGALKSSPHDLLVFLQAHLGQAPARLAAPLQACHEIRARTFPPASRLQRLANRGHEQNPCLDQNQEGIALGWHAGRLANSGLKVLWHHGATGGYRAFVGFIQERQLAAVVLANSRLKLLDGIRGTTATDRLGFEILEHMAENS
jgi:CubicO group peptidase (beta-lactamase class C family)